MTGPIVYGKLQSEKSAEENQLCREIAREVSLLGISDRQRMLVIYLLALELENSDAMQEITECVKDVSGGNIFLSTYGDDDGKTRSEG